MTRVTYDIVREPLDATYAELIRQLGQRAASFSLIVRDEIDVSPRAGEVLASLSAELTRTERVTEWPGTQLVHGHALRHDFSVSEGSIKILVDAATRLYAWKQPDLPEDLCFYRSSGDVLMGSISHECDGFLVLDRRELEALRSAVTDLKVAASRS